MSKDELWHLQNSATLDLVTDDSSEPVPVAGLQDVTVIPQEQVEIYYTADSTKIADRFSHEKQVAVDITYAFFDGELVREWLGGAGSATGDWEDTTDTQLFELTGEFVSSDSSQEKTFTVPGISFEEMPIVDATRGEWDEYDLTGIGEDLLNFEVGTPT